MKIEPTRLSKADTIKAKNKASQGGSALFTSNVSQGSKSSEIGQISATQSIATIWAVQEVDSPLEKRKRAIKKGNEILKTLSALQKSIGSGDDIGRNLKEIQYLLLEKFDAQDDPNLQEILDAIYLRASVEAAKFNI
jgi:hypothetical protein